MSNDALVGVQWTDAGVPHCRVVKCAAQLKVSEWGKPTLIQAVSGGGGGEASSSSSVVASDASGDAWWSAASAGGEGVQPSTSVMHKGTCSQPTVCLGCSGAWRAVQGAPEGVQPWGATDLLRFDPVHGASVQVEVCQWGSAVAWQAAALECDLVHALVHDGGHADTVCLWFFVPPYHAAKLRRLVGSRGAVSPEALRAADLDALSATQALRDAVYVPPGWLSFRVYTSRVPAPPDAPRPPAAVGVHWRLLRAASLNGALRLAHAQRQAEAGVSSVSLTGVAFAAASEKLDVLEQLRLAPPAARDDAAREKRNAVALLRHVLAALQAEVLEDALQEGPIAVSALSALMYEPTLVSLDAGVPAALQAAVKLASNSTDKPRRAVDADPTLDPTDLCHVCRVALFNLRRADDAAALCTACYAAFGYKHALPLLRRLDSDSLKRLVRAVGIAVGVAGTGVEFLHKHDAPNHADDGHADADMPMSSFAFSVQQHHRQQQQQQQQQQSQQGQQGQHQSKRRRKEVAPPPPPTATATAHARVAAAEPAERAPVPVPTAVPASAVAAATPSTAAAPTATTANATANATAAGAGHSDDDGGAAANGHAHPHKSSAAVDEDEDDGRATGGDNGDDDDDDDEEDRIDCICGRNDDRGFMLFCDRCRVWLHGKCVNITKKTVPDVFICPRCEDK